ncbi:MAG: hypothetical protein NVSMB2_26120 [Chloroflexota bacterium]
MCLGCMKAVRTRGRELPGSAVELAEIDANLALSELRAWVAQERALAGSKS